MDDQPEADGLWTDTWITVDQFKSLVTEKYTTPETFISNIILDGYANHLELMEDLVDPNVFSKSYTKDIAVILDGAEYFGFKTKDQTINRKIIWPSRDYQHHYRGKVWKSKFNGSFRAIKYARKSIWHPMQRITDEFEPTDLTEKDGYWFHSYGQKDFFYKKSKTLVIKTQLQTSAT